MNRDKHRVNLSRELAIQILQSKLANISDDDLETIMGILKQDDNYYYVILWEEDMEEGKIDSYHAIRTVEDF